MVSIARCKITKLTVIFKNVDRIVKGRMIFSSAAEVAKE